jgi:hypothetical protein
MLALLGSTAFARESGKLGIAPAPGYGDDPYEMAGVWRFTITHSDGSTEDFDWIFRYDPEKDVARPCAGPSTRATARCARPA